MAVVHQSESNEDAWNPGIQSSLPAEFLPLSTMFRPENVFTSIESATELSDFTGLKLHEVVRFRPERLIVHELLIRVSADIFISDGSKYEDLGCNFRKAASTIHQKYIEPKAPEIVEKFNQLELQIQTKVEEDLSATLFTQPKVDKEPQSKFSLFGLFKSSKKPKKTAPHESAEMRNQRILTTWTEKSGSMNDPLSRAIFRGIVQSRQCYQHQTRPYDWRSGFVDFAGYRLRLQ